MGIDESLHPMVAIMMNGDDMENIKTYILEDFIIYPWHFIISLSVVALLMIISTRPIIIKMIPKTDRVNSLTQVFSQYLIKSSTFGLEGRSLFN